MEHWREWNEIFNEKIFHEVGYLLATKTSMTDADHKYEWASYQNLLAIGKKPDRLTASDYADRFPGFHKQAFTDGFYHAEGGFAESGRAVELLSKYAESIGVEVFENSTVDQIISEKNEIQGVTTREGHQFNAGHVIVCRRKLHPISGTRTQGLYENYGPSGLPLETVPARALSNHQISLYLLLTSQIQVGTDFHCIQKKR